MFSPAQAGIQYSSELPALRSYYLAKTAGCVFILMDKPLQRQRNSISDSSFSQVYIRFIQYVQAKTAKVSFLKLTSLLHLGFELS